jgi:hypothetical protein
MKILELFRGLFYAGLTAVLVIVVVVSEKLKFLK